MTIPNASTPLQSKKNDVKERISEEDQSLIDTITLIVERLIEPPLIQENSRNIKVSALEQLQNVIKTSTSSMTNVPKPIKFLQPHFPELKRIFDENYSFKADDLMQIDSAPSNNTVSLVLDKECLVLLGDILSVLCMAYGAKDQQASLYYRMAVDSFAVDKSVQSSSTLSDIGFWGHEYVRHLSMEIIQEYSMMKGYINIAPQRPFLDEASCTELAKRLVPYFMEHHAEPDAIDLLIELDLIHHPLFLELIHPENQERVLLYLSQCSDFEADPETKQRILDTIQHLYEKTNQYIHLFLLYLKRGFPLSQVYGILTRPSLSLSQRLQLAFCMARQGLHILPESTQAELVTMCSNTDIDTIISILSNTWLGPLYRSLAANEFEVMQLKSLDALYKVSGATDTSRFSHGLFSTATNTLSSNSSIMLANSLASSIVHFGLSLDIFSSEESLKNAISQSKGYTLASIFATFGWIYMWNMELGLEKLDPYLQYSYEDAVMNDSNQETAVSQDLYKSNVYKKAGSVLALGALSCGVYEESQPTLALVSEILENENTRKSNLNVNDPIYPFNTNPNEIITKMGIFSLGLAYTGTRNTSVQDLLLPYLFLSSQLEEPSSEFNDTDVKTPTSYIVDMNQVEVCLFTAISLSLISCGGEPDAELVSAFLSIFIEHEALFTSTSVKFINISSDHPLSEVSKRNSSSTNKVKEANDAFWASFKTLFCVAFGLLFLNCPSYNTDLIEDTLLVLSDDSMRTSIISLLSIMKNAGSGSVLIVQTCINTLNKPSNIPNKNEDKTSSSTNTTTAADDITSGSTPTDTSNQEKSSRPFDVDEMIFALLGVLLVPLGEETSTEMTYRLLVQFLSHLPGRLRHLVPLFIPILNTSNPNLRLIEVLGKTAHDIESLELSFTSILALGFMGLGTNHAKIQGLLRDLWHYYSTNSTTSNNFASHLSMIRIALGLCSAGKSLLTGICLSYHHQLIDRSRLTCLILFLVWNIHAPLSTFDLFPYIFMLLTPLVRPRFLHTISVGPKGIYKNVDTSTQSYGVKEKTNVEDTGANNKGVTSPFNDHAVSVRVGHAMDVVGQAGRPKSLTGFQTLSTPVLLASDERAELATQSYISLTPFMEHVVIIEKRTDIMDEE